MEKVFGRDNKQMRRKSTNQIKLIATGLVAFVIASILSAFKVKQMSIRDMRKEA